MRKPFLAVVLTSMATAGVISPAAAQRMLQPGKDYTQVYVRDSATAVEKFDLAQRMERLGEWNKAAEIYQDTLVGYADRVVPVSGADGAVSRYTSVVSAVQERLARWPDPGRSAYRARYEVEAQAQLDAVRNNDLPALHRVYSTYFLTDAAREAGMRLIDAQLEAGEFAAAAWVANRLLDVHPDLGPHRPVLIYRAAMAQHLSGDTPAAQARLAMLQKESPEAIGRIRGADTRLADALETELATPRPVAATLITDSWPMAFGSPDHSRLLRAVDSAGARLASVELARLNNNPGVAGASPAMIDSDRNAGYMTGVMPVVDRGELFFHDNVRVYAISVESGLALPGWSQTYDGERNGAYTTTGTIPTPRGQLCTIAVTDDTVLAIMGQADSRSVMMGTAGRHDTRLVALDRRTGREKWVARPRQLADSAPANVSAKLRDLDLVGSPLVVDDRVFLQARGGNGMQFEDSYVLCLEAATGKLLWASYVASSNIVGDVFTPVIDRHPQSVSHLAYSSGRVFCLSNLGAVAALSAYDGTIAWLSLYPREEPNVQRFQRGLRQSMPPEKPWTFNPVIVADGKVYVLPSDGVNLHVYDAGSGSELGRVALALKDNKADGVREPTTDLINTLVGVLPGTSDVVVLSDRKALRINWQTFNPANPNSAIWVTALPPSPRGARQPGNVAPQSDGRERASSVRGRAFLTTDSLIVPLSWSLMTITTRNGLVAKTYPGNDAPWPDDEAPGNVLAASEYLIVSGPNRVSVYTDIQGAVARLDAAIDAAPADPNARLRYAEVMFVSNRLDVAMDKLDEAVQLLGGRATMAVGPARERLFADALAFAQKLARNRTGTGEQIDAMFALARDAAHSPTQQVSVRLSHASYARSVTDPKTELKMHQEILQSPELRSVAIGRGDANGVRPAALIAMDAIKEILARPQGRELYEPYETAATAALEANRARSDPNALLEISQSYPNAQAGRQAALLAADVFESSGNPRQAVQSLRQLYFRLPSNAPERARTIEALARNYLAMPNQLDAAAARLSQAAKLPGKLRLTRPMRLPDGQVLRDITFAEAFDAVRRIQSTAAASALPDLRLPPMSQAPALRPATDSPVIEGVTALCPPLRDFTRLDRVVVYAPATGIAVYAPGSDQPAFTSNALAEGPRGVAWSGGNLLAWDRNALVMLDGISGQTVWQIAVTALPATDALSVAGGVMNDPAPAELALDARDAVEAGEIEIAAGQNENLRRIQQQRQLRGIAGAVAPGAQARIGLAAAPDGPRRGPETITAVQPLSDRVVIATSDGRVAVADLVDGKLQWQARSVKAPIDKLLANDDFIVARIVDQTITHLVAMETAQGQVVFRRRFMRSNSGAVMPVNIGLASDGMLVWVMPDRVSGKDLFQPDEDMRFGATPNTQDANAYQLAGGDDQFVIADGRIVALSDQGFQIRVLSLDTGRLLRGEGGADMMLATGRQTNDSMSPIFRVVGSMLYSLSSRALNAYDLDRPGVGWPAALGVEPLAVREMLLTRGHVLIVGVRADDPRVFRVYAYSRRIGADGRESGTLDHRIDCRQPEGINAWQAVDGGIYYLSNDQRLHFLASTGK